MFEAPGTTATADRPEMQDGEDFVCPNCSCEIRLIHHGDPAKMQNMQMFTYCCGTKMEKEHPDR